MQDINSMSVGGNALAPKTGATQCHAQLGLPDTKVVQLKGWLSAIYWDLEPLALDPMIVYITTDSYRHSNILQLLVHNM